MESFEEEFPQQAIKVKQYVPPQQFRIQPTTLAPQVPKASFTTVGAQSGVQLKSGPPVPQTVNSLPQQIPKPRRPFVTGGLSQIAPPPAPKVQDNQDKDSLQGSEDEEDVTNLAKQKELNAVIIEEEEGEEEAHTRPAQVSGRQSTDNQEVKVTVHNKQLLMDVLMGN